MRLLVYHIGSLGDTLVAVPALWAVRETYPDAHITMLTDEQPRQSLVQACAILDGSGLIDDYIVYPVGKPLAMARLLFRLRVRKFDRLIYLIKAPDGHRRIRRDACFFRLAGMRKFIGIQGLEADPPSQPGKPMPVVPHVADTLLARLRASGLQTPTAGQGRFYLNIGVSEQERVNRWRTGLPDDGSRPWIAVGPGSKMPSKVWPYERYVTVLRRLIEDYDLWPIAFGGPSDRELDQRMVLELGRGYVAAGALSVRESMAAMEKCVLYLGNDTGTMHMAAASGLRCVAVFSSREYPGKWYPYGNGHKILRTPVSCEGCMLEECIDEGMRCVLSISVDNVLEACYNVLREEALRKQAN